MIQASLFSGIGGFDLASDWAGWENAFHCEINPFGRKILKYYWPNAISYDDITKTDFTIWRGRIDVLTGGFPCQPFSLAGKRLGTADDRNLWPEYHRAIREIQPTWVVGENVPGLLNWSGGLVFEQVQADLENEGYEVWPVILPACSVNAPHRRDRVWFVAYSRLFGQAKRQQPAMGFEQFCEEQFTSNPDLSGRNDPNKQEPLPECCNTPEHCDVGKESFTTNTPSHRRQRAGQKLEIEKGLQPRPEPARELAGRPEGFRDNGNASNPDSQRQQECHNAGKPEQQKRVNGSFSSPENWQNFPTQPPVCGGDDGFPGRLDGITFSKWRNESIKAYGNAIVPQVAYQIFKAINEYESNL